MLAHISNGVPEATAFIICVVIYFLPTFVAGLRHHPNGNAIGIVNLFLGWTFIGWVVALAWSASAIKKER